MADQHPDAAEQLRFMHERLLSAAKEDNEELVLEVFKEGEGVAAFDVNHGDGLGNTALHYAVQRGSLTVLEHLLSHDSCDVDPQNRLDRDTPLHFAVKVSHPDPQFREYVVEQLLEAGADTTVKNKHGEKPIDVLPAGHDNAGIVALLRKATAQSGLVGAGDIADDDDDDGEPGSGTESE